MRLELKIAAIWLAMLILLRLSLFLPHRYIEDIGVINAGLQILLFLLSIQIARKSYKDQKYLFINFAVFFGLTIALFLSVFIGQSLFQNSVYAGLYYHMYVNKLALNFSIVLAIAFLAVDYFFSHWSIIRKYALAVGCTASIVGMFFLPFIITPFQLYHEQEYVALGQLETAKKNVQNTLHHEPNEEELTAGFAAIVTQSRTAESAHADYSHARETVRTLSPYLAAGGKTSIFWKPMELISIYLHSIVLIIIAIMLFSLYKQNKPIGAYIDKILLLFFIICLLEILHLYGSMQSTSSEEYFGIYKVGQYMTVMIFLVMVYAFDTKLRFVCSATGSYYEKALQEAPGKITRWRDELDTYILNAFFKKNSANKHFGHLTKTTNDRPKGNHES